MHSLTKTEINQLLPTFQHKANKYAKSWWIRYGQRVELAAIQSATMFAAWESLKRFEKDGGKSVEAWVMKAMWDGARNAARAEQYKIDSRPPHMAITEKVSRRLKGEDGQDQIDRINRSESMQRITEMARLHLTENELCIFECMYKHDLGQWEIAKIYDISSSAVSETHRRLINKLRAVCDLSLVA